MKTRFFFPVVAMMAFMTVTNAAVVKVDVNIPRVEAVSINNIDAEEAALFGVRQNVRSDVRVREEVRMARRSDAGAREEVRMARRSDAGVREEVRMARRSDAGARVDVRAI